MPIVRFETCCLGARAAKTQNYITRPSLMTVDSKEPFSFLRVSVTRGSEVLAHSLNKLRLRVHYSTILVTKNKGVYCPHAVYKQAPVRVSDLCEMKRL